MNNIKQEFFQARHLRSIFGSKVSAVTESWDKLHGRRASKAVLFVELYCSKDRQEREVKLACMVMREVHTEFLLREK